jgi:RHS repeat-associated protein
VATVTANGALGERIKYSAYGVPFGMPQGDVNGDGVVNSTDSSIIQSHITGSTCDEVCDLDLDGDVDNDDKAICDNNVGYTLGWGKLSLDGNRRGYAGYEFDPVVSKYHVRHRVLDPELGLWQTRDPIGYAGGINLYEYVMSNPLAYVDPMGLHGCAGGGCGGGFSPDTGVSPGGAEIGHVGPTIVTGQYQVPCTDGMCVIAQPKAPDEPPSWLEADPCDPGNIKDWHRCRMCASRKATAAYEACLFRDENRDPRGVAECEERYRKMRSNCYNNWWTRLQKEYYPCLERHPGRPQDCALIRAQIFKQRSVCQEQAQREHEHYVGSQPFTGEAHIKCLLLFEKIYNDEMALCNKRFPDPKPSL